MDMSKPVWDACREDGTLKDTSELEWPDSPTEYNRAVIEDMFNSNNDEPSGDQRPEKCWVHKKRDATMTMTIHRRHC